MSACGFSYIDHWTNSPTLLGLSSLIDLSPRQSQSVFQGSNPHDWLECES